jgi:hypothetical protein
MKRSLDIAQVLELYFEISKTAKQGKVWISTSFHILTVYIMLLNSNGIGPLLLNCRQCDINPFEQPLEIY